MEGDQRTSVPSRDARAAGGAPFPGPPNVCPAPSGWDPMCRELWKNNVHAACMPAGKPGGAWADLLMGLVQAVVMQ